MRKLMITFLLALGCSSAMATQLYKWVDENGVNWSKAADGTTYRYDEIAGEWVAGE